MNLLLNGEGQSRGSRDIGIGNAAARHEVRIGKLPLARILVARMLCASERRRLKGNVDRFGRLVGVDGLRLGSGSDRDGGVDAVVRRGT